MPISSIFSYSLWANSGLKINEIGMRIHELLKHSNDDYFVNIRVHLTMFQNFMNFHPNFVNFWFGYGHGLRTPNEGINQSYLKNWANVADKICFGRT